MRPMPAIPESTRSSILLRLLDHAENNWPQLAKVQARYHGSFAYITGILPGGEQIPLFRSATAAQPTPSASRSTHPHTTDTKRRPAYRTAHWQPPRALDIACIVHLAGLGHEHENRPPTNLRCHQLKALLMGFRWSRKHYT